MARKTVRVEVPTKRPEDFSKLLNNIKKQHTALGADSQLTDIDMETFSSLLAQADDLRDQSENLKAQSEEKMQQARNIYGTESGQSVATPGTLYNLCNLIKKTLLLKYAGNEAALGAFGFDVVTGQAKSPQAKKKAA